MNINPKIFTVSGPELASYAFFHDMVKIMKAADGVEPAGACCGRNISQITNSFLNNKQKYFNFMKNINERLIQPLKKGTVYISPMKKMLNYGLMTDNEIILCVKKGYLSEKIFDWTEYNKAQKSAEEETIAVESVEVEIPVAESPAESPAEEETPVVKTPKRSTKRGSK